MHSTFHEVSDLYAEIPWAILDRMTRPREQAQPCMLYVDLAVMSHCMARIILQVL